MFADQKKSNNLAKILLSVIAFVLILAFAALVWKYKSSDFGMARIFGGHQHEANTNRVVGT